MWVLRREPGGCTGAGVGVAVSSSLPRRSGPSFGSLWSLSWGGHFLLWAAGSVSRRVQCLSWISSLFLSAPPSIPFSLTALLPLTPELMRWVPKGKAVFTQFFESPGSLGSRGASWEQRPTNAGFCLPGGLNSPHLCIVTGHCEGIVKPSPPVCGFKHFFHSESHHKMCECVKRDSETEDGIEGLSEAQG